MIRSLFVRAIAAIYLSAFLSINSQIVALYGQQGISPVTKLLEPAVGEPILPLFLSYPTVFWFNSSDAALTVVAIVGAFASLLALFGVLCGPSLLVAWFFYLSIVTVGQEFMSFQWDILLLETGFLSIFFASWRPFDYLVSTRKAFQRMADSCEPSIVMIWLYRLLLFRLMFESGLVKLLSGDQTWRNLTAMTYHFETQPLPTPIGWLAQQLPNVLLMATTVSVFFIELVVPFLIFAPRKVRAISGCFLIFLQILILLTGSYCFFNLLTISLCLLLLDDRMICGVARAFTRVFVKSNKAYSSQVSEMDNNESNQIEGTRNESSVVRRIPSRISKALVVLVALLVVGLSVSSVARFTGSAQGPLYMVASQAIPWHIVSSYGLFAVMTTKRLEISVEGSMDGKVWEEYVFRFKPGPLNRAPAIVAPHQPRLDWQMWFAALGSVGENLWFVRFCQMLMSNSPEALSLIEKNPFASKPPKYIRAVVYDYHMTDLSTLFQTGNWWRRERLGEYLPPLTKIDESVRPR
ncbi:MAG: lipase maturation factor family protein [Candidatus Obscuribacterales bacterium]|nr:lipase maturation factor family protein [Candidatus Obscuribacterales bacterium]